MAKNKKKTIVTCALSELPAMNWDAVARRRRPELRISTDNQSNSVTTELQGKINVHLRASCGCALARFTAFLGIAIFIVTIARLEIEKSWLLFLAGVAFVALCGFLGQEVGRRISIWKIQSLVNAT